MAGGIFYLIHHIVVKTSLFLSAGAVETATGRGSLKELGGLRHGNPLLAAAFLIGALALAGVPPSSGFFAKLILIQGAFGSDRVLAGGLLAVPADVELQLEAGQPLDDRADQRCLFADGAAGCCEEKNCTGDDRSWMPLN